MVPFIHLPPSWAPCCPALRMLAAHRHSNFKLNRALPPPSLPPTQVGSVLSRVLPKMQPGVAVSDVFTVRDMRACMDLCMTLCILYACV